MKSRSLAVLAIPLLVLAACDSSTSPKGAGNVSLSFASTSGSRQADLVQSDTTKIGGHTVVISNADVSFSRIMLKKVEADTGTVEDDRDEGMKTELEHEQQTGDAVRFDSTTVALPLGGGLITPISVPVAPGDYRSIEMGVSSVRLRGTYDGQAFDVTVPVHAEFRQRFSPPLHIASDSDHVNVTINVFPSTWLLNGTTLIDPRQIAGNQQLDEIVARNIRMSFHSFRDGDKNGRDDDHGD